VKGAQDRSAPDGAPTAALVPRTGPPSDHRRVRNPCAGSDLSVRQAVGNEANFFWSLPAIRADQFARAIVANQHCHITLDTRHQESGDPATPL
jgi:hypothetical protein